ncbi:MAG: ribosomal protein S18-alanine N-acetyltransferase [bacterium]
MLNILPMKDEDILSTVDIENVSFSAPKSEAVFKEDEHKYLVVKEAGKVLGYIGIEKIEGETHIINMAVLPERRKQGIGQKLIEAIINDQDVFFLEVRISNLAAQRLYGRFGFKVVGTRKKYYENNGEDAYTMKREPESN